MDKWDPQREDFESDFNSYDRGPGQHFNRKMDFSDGVKLYVTGIPNEITEEGLHNMFSQCGNCLSVKKCISKQADAGDTYGFVIMKTQTDAITAIASYNNHAINRFKMRVQVALDEETMKRHKQKKLEEEMFYQNLPSVKAEQKMKQQMQSKPLRAITRTIENGHQSDTDSSSDGRYRKTKKGPGSVMNGHEDSSIPGLQHISGMSMSRRGIMSGNYVQRGPVPYNVASPGYPDDRGQRLPGVRQPPYYSKAVTREKDDTLEIDPSVLHYQVSPRSRGALGRGYFNEDPYYSDHNYRPGRGRGFYGNTYQDMNNGYGGGYGRGMSTHDSWGYHHGRGGFLNDYRDRQYRPRPNNPDYPFDDDYGGYATDYDGYQGGYRRGHFDGHRARGRRGNQGYPGDFGRGRGFGPVRRRGSTESLLSVGGPKKPVMEVEARPCLLCGKPGQFQCGRCKGPYCTAACQKSHWSTHKKECGQKKKEIEDDDDGGFEVSIGNDIVQQTKSLVEKHTGEEIKVTKKPKQEINQQSHSEPKARPAQQPSLDYSQGVKPKTTRPVTPANNTRAKEQISPVTPPQAKQYVNGVNSSAAVTETRGATCTFNTLSLNEPTDVLVSEVVNPGEIWVQLLTQEFQEVEPLRERMTKVYQSSTGNVVKPRIGDMYAGMFSLDNNWYRARVDAVEGDKLSVTYMDYGNKETVSCSKLRQLQQDMLQLPLQAIECCLKDMKPLEGDSWGRGAEDVLKIVCPPTTMCSKLYRATAHSVTGSKYTVSLEDMDGEDIGEKLIKSKTVSCTKDNEEEVTCSAAAAAAATVGEPTAAAVSALPYSTLPLQENSLVLVTQVVSPDEIWVQQADQAIIDRGNQVTAAIFEKMRGKEIPPATNACVGNLYAAPFSGSFYRARLDAFVQQDRVEVTYVEFGNKEIVSLCELFELTSELKSVPFSVVHCCLDGIVPCSGTNWNREAVLKLQELLQKSEESGEFYEAFCIESAGHLLKVKLVNRTVKDKDIAAKLVEAGVAKYGNRNTPVYPPVSGVSPSSAAAAAAATVREPTASAVSALPYSTLPLQENSLVLVTQVVSPDEIWVQQADQAIIDRGNQVTAAIFEKMRGKEIPPATNACVGNLYAAPFSGSFYRARLDAFVQQDRVEVTYVEFGNKEIVSLCELFELTSELKSVPFSVVHCCLDGIVPCSGTNWNREAVLKLQELLQKSEESGEFYEAFCIESAGHLLKVKLVNRTVKDKDIAAKLVEAGVAKYGNRNTPVYPPVSGVSPSAAGGENQAAAAVSIPAEAKPAATGPTDASSLAYSKFTVKQKTAVLVQEVESPDEIWVQEALEEVVLSGKAVTTDINLKIINENKLPQAVNACVGNLYAAMFEKFWYRARLDSFEDSETVNVTYVEFGNKGTVKLSELKELEPDQKVVPFSVVHCFLDGIVPVSGSDWSHEAIQTLKEITPCAGVYEVFCNEGLGHLMKVKLFNDKGEDIAEKLVQKGVARPGKRDPPVYPPVPNARQVKPRPLVLAKSLGCVMDNMQMNQKLENLNIIDFKSPALFVVQIVAEKLVRDYKQIAEELDTVCVAAEPTEYRPEQVGQLVVGKFEGQWYRAEVIEMKESSVKVRYIDFGNEALNDFSTIQQATELCTTIPAQACFCGLADVSVPHSGEWPPNVLQKFFELASMMEPKPLEAVYKGSVDGISMIDIMDCKEGKSIAAVLSQELSGAKPKSPAAKSPVAQPQQQVKTLIKACDVPMESLPLNGTRVKAGIIDITSFDLFFLHLAERQDDLDKLKQHLATYCELDTPHNPVAGELVCAKFSLDKVWYRAEVLKVTEDNLYQVMFVDWGNCETVSSHSIREIHASLATLPKQAIHCRLKGVKHDDQIEESFIEFVSCVNKILLEVQADTFENNIYSVTVIGDEGFNFNEHFGVKGKKPEVQAPEKLLSPFPQPAGASVKFAIGGKHPPENEEFFVAVTHIESPHEFYCQFADNEALHNLVLLMQNMMMYCEMEAVNPAFSPVVGDLCCAMFTDSQWYRGEILKVFPDKSFQVKYFDFGNKEVISGEQIREMKSEYLELPKLAFKCSLTDVMPAEGQSWDSAPKEKMQKLSDNKVLTAKCVGRSEDDAYLLELWHKDETRNINFAEILKSNGLARSAAPPPPPARNGEAVDKETMLLEQIAALQAQLMSLKTNK